MSSEPAEKRKTSDLSLALIRFPCLLNCGIEKPPFHEKSSKPCRFTACIHIILLSLKQFIKINVITSRFQFFSNFNLPSATFIIGNIYYT